MSEGRIKAFKNKGRDLAVSSLNGVCWDAVRLLVLSTLGYETAEIRCDSGTEKGVCMCSSPVPGVEVLYAVCSVVSRGGNFCACADVPVAIV